MISFRRRTAHLVQVAERIHKAGTKPEVSSRHRLQPVAGGRQVGGKAPLWPPALHDSTVQQHVLPLWRPARLHHHTYTLQQQMAGSRKQKSTVVNHGYRAPAAVWSNTPPRCPVRLRALTTAAPSLPFG